MFNKLKEKFASWLKKKPEETKEKIVEPPKKEKKEKELDKVEKKKELKTKEKTPKKEIILKQEKPLKILEEEPIKEISKTTEEELEKAPEEKKQGFLKKLFSRKKEEILTQEKKLQEQENQKIVEKKIEKEVSHIESEAIIKKELEAQPPLIEFPPLPEKEGFFSKLTKKLTTSTLTQKQFDEIFPDLEITLLENNVALQVVDKIHDSLSKDLVGIEVKKSEIEKTILNSLKDTISSILIEPPSLLEKINKSLDIFIIIFVGINGSGKTTSLAKLAYYLKQNNITCCLAAADTFRAASIEQLKEHASRLKIPIISHEYGADPAAVAFDAKKYAKANKIKVVLIDTAGRMYTKTNLIKEMEKIVRISKPDLKIFVGESITGNDATEQAKTFNEAIDIDGIILSKADVDEKAGTILSVSYITNKPIYFLGTGQKYEDLTPFTKSTILKNLGL